MKEKELESIYREEDRVICDKLVGMQENIKKVSIERHVIFGDEKEIIKRKLKGI